MFTGRMRDAGKAYLMNSDRRQNIIAFLIAFALVSIVAGIRYLRSDDDTPDIENDAVLKGRVIAVNNGDTFRARVGSKVIRVRMHGIDAPEANQPYGPESVQHLQSLLGRGELTIDVVRRDGNGNTYATVFRGPVNINLAMVQDGYAWHNDLVAPDEIQLAGAQIDAQIASRGLWRDLKPIPPWEWRRGKR